MMAKFYGVIWRYWVKSSSLRACLLISHRVIQLIKNDAMALYNDVFTERWMSNTDLSADLTNYGLDTPYDDTDLGQHWLRGCLVA